MLIDPTAFHVTDDSILYVRVQDKIPCRWTRDFTFSAFTLLVLSFSLRPIESLRENTLLILFVHGSADHAIPPEHSERMKEATKRYAEIHLIPGAAHAVSILTDPKAYSEYVANFLAEQFPGK